MTYNQPFSKPKNSHIKQKWLTDHGIKYKHGEYINITQHKI